MHGIRTILMQEKHSHIESSKTRSTYHIQRFEADVPTIVIKLSCLMPQRQLGLDFS